MCNCVFYFRTLNSFYYTALNRQTIIQLRAVTVYFIFQHEPNFKKKKQKGGKRRRKEIEGKARGGKGKLN